MASQTLADQALTKAWVDLTVALPSLVNADALIQNVGGGAIAVVWGGTDPTSAGMSGIVRGPRDVVSGNAANVWARSIDGSGVVSVTLA